MDLYFPLHFLLTETFNDYFLNVSDGFVNQHQSYLSVVKTDGLLCQTYNHKNKSSAITFFLRPGLLAETKEKIAEISDIYC